MPEDDTKKPPPTCLTRKEVGKMLGAWKEETPTTRSDNHVSMIDIIK